LVLNEQGKVLAANHLIEALTGYVQWRAQDRVSFNDRAADQLLHDAIAAVDLAGGAVCSFPVRDAAKRATMVAHIVFVNLGTFEGSRRLFGSVELRTGELKALSVDPDVRFEEAEKLCWCDCGL
jgi:hypothetical protein